MTSQTNATALMVVLPVYPQDCCEISTSLLCITHFNSFLISLHFFPAEGHFNNSIRLFLIRASDNLAYSFTFASSDVLLVKGLAQDFLNWSPYVRGDGATRRA